jgi:polyisoprenoid-binding protein YceI
MRRIALLIAGIAVAASTSRAADTYKVDAVHSTVLFKIKHMNASYSYGRFNAIEGAFALDEKDPSKCSFNVNLKVDSVDTANPGRDGHLKGPDFFNAKQFPTISFKSKSVASAGKGVFDVTGDLTLHGVTKSVKVAVEPTGASKDPRGRAIAGVEGSFRIKRSEFGMSGMLAGIGDDVLITISLEGGK